MRNHKKFLVICAILAGAGAVLAGIGIAAGGIVHGIQINSKGIQVYAPLLAQNEKGEDAYIKKEERIEEFDSIEVDMEYADIRIERSDSDAYMLSYCLSGRQEMLQEVKDGKLVLKQADSKTTGIKQVNVFNWFMIGSASMDAGREFVAIRLPKDVKLSEVLVKTDSGDAVCENIQADSLHIAAEYGDVSLHDVKAEETEIVMESGKLQMEQVQGGSCSIADEYGNASFYDLALTGDLRAEMESGDIRFHSTSVQNLELESAYGNINGQQIEAGSLKLTVEDGNCKLVDALFENCKIQSSYGNVDIELQKDVADYGYQLAAEYGSIKINGKEMGELYSSLDNTWENLIQIQCESGNIRIN